MANEKKNGTLEEIIMEMLKEGKAVRIPLKDVVDKLQENVKAAEDAQEAVQPETEKSEAVPQGGQVKTGLCEKVILAVLAAQEEYLDSIWGENMDEEDKA